MTPFALVTRILTADLRSLWLGRENGCRVLFALVLSGALSGGVGGISSEGRRQTNIRKENPVGRAEAPRRWDAPGEIYFNFVLISRPLQQRRRTIVVA